MRFLMRSLAGLTLLVLTLGLLGLAVGSIRQALALREAEAAGGRTAEERVFAVSVDRLEPRTVAPVLTAYGDLQSARQLELRAATAGTLMEIAPGFRDGGRVAAGEVLYRIDPAEAETALALAESDLAAARAEEAEAGVGLDLARQEAAAADRQRDLRAQALARAQDLRNRGVNTAADLEAAELALATAEQAATGRRLAEAQAEARIERAGIATTRAGIARDEAARDLANTVERAPFDGLVADVSAVPGRLVSVNEQLGLLLDPAALEVAFRVSKAEFARLADASGELLPLAVTASLEVEGIELSVPGRIDRAGASVGAGQTGRLIYARLDEGPPGLLRPGDFLTVRVAEPDLEEVAVLPAAAVSPEGRILLLGPDRRLEEVAVRVLRRQGGEAIVADVPFGRDFVTARQPQLGPGVLVRPAGPEAAAGALPEAMVRLTPERRAGLIAAVEANGRMPQEAKARILAALEAEEVPQSMVDRLETRRSGG
ncbi:MAG: HlyD family efflux transporter periplasmic adaptor subunit [Rhodobacteraceae bacterium]|nr:HlyD family efflux transporter periplasmic adaptor subunit [Paracoccaceae bacterium]